MRRGVQRRRPAPAQDLPLAAARNLGPASARWLAAVGIHTLDDLRKVGPVNAYNLVRSHGYNASLNLLWALYGAVEDLHWTRIPASVKSQLRQRLEGTT